MTWKRGRKRKRIVWRLDFGTPLTIDECRARLQGVQSLSPTVEQRVNVWKHTEFYVERTVKLKPPWPVRVLLFPFTLLLVLVAWWWLPPRPETGVVLRGNLEETPDGTRVYGQIIAVNEKDTRTRRSLPMWSGYLLVLGLMLFIFVNGLLRHGLDTALLRMLFFAPWFIIFSWRYWWRVRTAVSHARQLAGWVQEQLQVWPPEPDEQNHVRKQDETEEQAQAQTIQVTEARHHHTVDGR